MQIIRTILWVLLLVALLIFTLFNWQPVEVKIWEELVVETKIPVLVITSFLLGLVPMWLLYNGMRWRLTRRVHALESAARNAAVAAAAAASSTDADEASPPPPPRPLSPSSSSEAL